MESMGLAASYHQHHNNHRNYSHCHPLCTAYTINIKKTGTTLAIVVTIYCCSIYSASQLLGGLLESNPGYVHSMESMGLAAQFFEFLSLEHANNNVHNIRLCRQIVSAGTMPPAELADLQVGEKVG